MISPSQDGFKKAALMSGQNDLAQFAYVSFENQGVTLLN
jgi:hypothetical protein